MQFKIHNKILQYYLDLLHSQKTYRTYCKCLVLKVIPLIRLIHRRLTERLYQEKCSYLAKRDALEKEGIDEIQVVFKDLKQALFQECLYKDPNIMKRIELLDSILNFQRESYFVDNEYDFEKKRIIPLRNNTKLDRKGVFIMPAQYEIAFDRLKDLCQGIVNINRYDLVESYIEALCSVKEYINGLDTIIIPYQCSECLKLFPVEFAAQNKFCPICKNPNEPLQQQSAYILQETTYIDCFNEQTFVPSLFKLRQLDDDFWSSSAGAWETLSSIEWYSNIDNRGFFKKDKKLRYDSAEQCAYSTMWLTRNLAREEIKAVKKKHGEKAHLLSRDHIDKFLGILIQELHLSTDSSTISDFYGPIEIKVDIVGLDLILTVYWTSELVGKYKMHSFQDKEKDAFRYTFFEQLVNKPCVFIELNEEYGDAKKYLIETGFKGIFYDLFITQSYRMGAMLKSNSIGLNDEPIAKIKKVRKQLETLKFMKWQICQD